MLHLGELKHYSRKNFALLDDSLEEAVVLEVEVEVELEVDSAFAVAQNVRIKVGVLKALSPRKWNRANISENGKVKLRNT